jgi:hypothetical protein
MLTGGRHQRMPGPIRSNSGEGRGDADITECPDQFGRIRAKVLALTVTLSPGKRGHRTTSGNLVQCHH